MTDFQKGLLIGFLVCAFIAGLIFYGVKADCSSYRQDYVKACSGLMF